MIASPEHSRFWAIAFPIKPWATFSAAWYSSCPQASAADQLGRLHSLSYGCARRHRFFQRRGAHLARLGNLLCTFRPPPGDAPGHIGRNHQTSDRRLDSADGSPGRGSARRRLAPDPLCSARSRHEILRWLSRRASLRLRSPTHSTGSQVPI
jgi:hypothetical protein